jgi:hypothetical protein
VQELAAPEAPAQLPAELRRQWTEFLTRPTVAGHFDPRTVEALPEPARRWLRFAIAPGTELRRCVELELHGRIRLGRWRSFRARQVLVGGCGYIWAERTRLFGLPLSGYDRLTAGHGEMRHAIAGRIPVVSATGADITHSAAGRLVAEMLLVPAAALDPGIRWSAVDEDTVTVTVPFLRHHYELTLCVAPDGEPRAAALRRWAQVGGAGFGEHRFVVQVDQPRTFDGFTIPTRVRAGYADNADGHLEPFIEQFVDDATFH